MISEAMPTFLYADVDMGDTGTRRKVDDFVKSHPNRWLCKEAKFKARESRGVRRTSCTPQRQRDEAQRRNWTIYEAIILN
jgi:hypothetical protein